MRSASFIFFVCVSVAYQHSVSVTGNSVPVEDNPLEPLPSLYIHRLSLGLAVAEHLVAGAENTDSQESESELQQIVERRAQRADKRIRRDLPYDLGTIDQCARPTVDGCNFPADVMIPEFTARLLKPLSKGLGLIRTQLNGYNTDASNPILSSGCIDALMQFLCDMTITPRCQENDAVVFPTMSVEVR